MHAASASPRRRLRWYTPLHAPVWLLWSSFITLATGGLGVLYSLFARSARLLDFFAVHVWSRSIAWAAGIRYEVHGAHRLADDGVYVFLSNHQSHTDIVVLYRALRQHVVFVAKKELTRIPVFGPALLHMGHVIVDRRDRESAVRSMREAGLRMQRDKLSVIVFPEGTRSRDGWIQPFRKGGVRLALDVGVPIVPVVIEGTHEVLPTHHRTIVPGVVHVHVLDPIDAKAWGEERRDELLDHLYRTMCEFQDGLRPGRVRPAPLPSRAARRQEPASSAPESSP